VAERMLASLATPIEVDGHEIWVSASIGLANFPSDGDNAETLLMRADAAMYEAKAKGRNGHTTYTAALDSNSLDRFRLEADLRKALDRDELRLHYQPIVNVRNGKMVGCEVLMRWQRHDRLVPPNDFIPIAEENGLIIPMGEWAIEAATRQISAWSNQGLDPLYVSVNLPGSHFQQSDLVSMIQGNLARSGLPAERLYIEITETVVMKAVEQTIRSLNELREMGVRMSIDDFGTGYSSLAYLKRLPINTLKIDRSFIKDIAVDSDDEVIVSAIIGLARSLNLSVVAEGVETPAQMAFLNMFGASLMQGYLFSRPCAPEQFEVLLRQNAGTEQPAKWTCPEGNRVIHLFDSVGRKGGHGIIAAR
jgi:EAL domain-containing protein (putative c-di-GMP-specific phosphodiesterase class I)